MSRRSMLCRVKRQIRMGIYESDDKWRAAIARLAADVRSKTIVELSPGQPAERSCIASGASAIDN